MQYVVNPVRSNGMHNDKVSSRGRRWVNQGDFHKGDGFEADSYLRLGKQKTNPVRTAWVKVQRQKAVTRVSMERLDGDKSKNLNTGSTQVFVLPSANSITDGPVSMPFACIIGNIHVMAALHILNFKLQSKIITHVKHDFPTFTPPIGHLSLSPRHIINDPPACLF